MEKTQAGLVRAIGRWSLLALAVNSVIGSGVFGLPAAVAGLLGKQSTLAVLVAGAAIGVIIACFAEVASYFEDAGGPYLYGRTAFGQLVGILVGWTMYLAQAAAPAANANLFVTYLAEFWPQAKNPAARFDVLTLLIGFLTLINMLGVKQGTRVSNLFTVAKIVPLLMIISSGAAIVILHPAPMPATAPSGGAWLKAMVLLFFAYGGFESALAPASEAKDPRRDTAFALLGSLIACTAIYALVQWVVVGVLGADATTDRPLAEVARMTMGERGAALVSVGAMLSVYGYLSAKLLAMPRVTFALAEERDLPTVFAAISRRFHTPWFSILIYALAVWGLAIVGNFTWNATLSVVARLFYYAVTCAALIALRRSAGAPPAVRRAPSPAVPSSEKASFRLAGGPVLAVVGILICLALLTQADLSKSRILLATFAAGIVNWLWARWISNRSEVKKQY